MGEEFFQHKFPTQRSDIMHWRQRLGEEFYTKVLQESLRIAHSSGALRTKDLKRIVVDTTVQPKAVTHPTEAKLRYRAMIKLGEAAKSAGIPLRQSYVRVGKLALIKSGRYRHAKQMLNASAANMEYPIHCVRHWRKRTTFINKKLAIKIIVIRGIVRKWNVSEKVKRINRMSLVTKYRSQRMFNRHRAVILFCM